MIRAVNAIATDHARTLWSGEEKMSRVVTAEIRKRYQSSYGGTVKHIECGAEKSCEGHAFYRAAPPIFQPYSAIPTTKHLVEWQSADTVKIRSLKGRLLVPAILSHYQANTGGRRHLDGILGFAQEHLLFLAAVKLPAPVTLAEETHLDFGLIEPEEGDIPPAPMPRVGRPQLRRLFPHMEARDSQHRIRLAKLDRPSAVS